MGSTELAITASELCNQNAIADVGTGASLAYGSLRASVLTVQFNLQMIDDETYVDEVSVRTDHLKDSAERKVATVAENVNS